MTLPPLYAIVDAECAARSGTTVPELARAFLAGGARLLQVRAKQAGSAALLEMCRRVVSDAAEYGALVLVNDRSDVAVLAGAGGVHTGQEDLRPSDIRRAFPGLHLVGLSTHTTSQLTSALSEPISYLAVGPVFGTTTKDTGYAAVGLDLVREARAAAVRAAGGGSPLPIVAIGGITLERAAAVVEAGATSVAVISDLLSTGDPESRVRAYLQHLAHP